MSEFGIEFVGAVLCAQSLSRVRLFATPVGPRLLCPWGFSRQEHWSGLPWLPQGDLPNQKIEPKSPAWQGDSLSSKGWSRKEQSDKFYLSKLEFLFYKRKQRPGENICKSCLCISYFQFTYRWFFTFFPALLRMKDKNSVYFRGTM